jgi:hypothetical protein
MTVRKTVRFVTTLRVYEYTPTPPKPVIETTGELLEESPTSRPDLRKVAPVLQFRRVGGQR